MQYIKMSYKGFVFCTNPSKLKINLKKIISNRAVPFGCSNTQEVSQDACVISGEGRFCGSDAFEKANELMRIFNQKGSAYLFVPDAMVIKAFFSKLDISYSASGGCVEYSFEFTEERNSKKSKRDFEFTYALDGENMYDIADRCGVDVEKMFAANGYEDLFCIKEGDKVWLG